MPTRKPTQESSPRRTGNRPGQSAREKQRNLVKAAPIKTFFTRLFDMNTDERAWGRGAEGEEKVGALLEGLGASGWTVLHDVGVGARGANVDHLLIGRPGVFVINTKMLSGDVRVEGDDILVDGRRRPFVDKQEAEAKRVRELLVTATGRRSLWVQGMVVFVNSRLVVGETPSNIVVLPADALVGWLNALPPKMDPGEVQELARAAWSEDTWA